MQEYLYLLTLHCKFNTYTQPESKKLLCIVVCGVYLLWNEWQYSLCYSYPGNRCGVPQGFLWKLLFICWTRRHMLTLMVPVCVLLRIYLPCGANMRSFYMSPLCHYNASLIITITQLYIRHKISYEITFVAYETFSIVLTLSLIHI